MCGSSMLRPLGMYSDQTRIPPTLAPIARASLSIGSPHPGIPSNPTSMWVRPTRDAMATPFHWLNPTWATS